MEFELEGKLYRYRVSLTAQRVYQESLHVHQQRTFAYVFTRVWNPDEQHYDIRQQHFGLLQKEAAKVRQNASLISTAAQYEVDLARQLTKMHITANVNVLGRQSVDHQRVFEVSNVYAQDDALRARMARILASWDLGLTDVRIEKHRVTREDGTPDSRDTAGDKIDLIGSTPCIEGLLLRVLGKPVPSQSVQCKKAMAQLTKVDLTDQGAYANLIPKARLDVARLDIPELDQLLRLLEGTL